MGHIFISFCDEDTDFAFELSNRILNQAKLDTWLYKDDSKLRAGAHWKREIDQAIKDCYALVVIVTPVANSSIYVAYEWAMALGLGKPVIPILLKDTRDMHPKLNDIQWEDFKQEKPWGRFIKNLQEQVDAYTAYTIRVPRDAPKLIHNTVALLDDPSPEERKHAIYELAQMNHPSISIILIEALRFVAPDVRALAAQELGTLGIVSAIPDLIAALDDKSDEVRRQAASALGQLKANSAIDALVTAFRKAMNFPTRSQISPFLQLSSSHAIIHALGAIGDCRSLPFLVEVMNNTERPDKDSAKSMQSVAISALEGFGDTAVPYLIDAFQSFDDTNLTYRIAKSLGNIGTKAAMEGLVKAIPPDAAQHKYTQVIQTLADIGDPNSIAALASLLDDENVDPSIRELARSTLGGMPMPEAQAVFRRVSQSRR